MDLFRGRPVMVGVPLAPDHKIDIRISSMIEVWDRRLEVESHYAATDNVTVGRDKIVQMAKYRIPRPSHILFIDYDVLPRRNTLEKLLAHDKDIVAGVYPMIQKCKISWCLSREEHYKPLPIEELPDNLFKTKFVGCGMMLVKMEVFDKLEWPYWKNEFKPGIKSLGEDLYFCMKARNAGLDIWVDPMVKCSHFRLVDLLSIALKKGKIQ